MDTPDKMQAYNFHHSLFLILPFNIYFLHKGRGN